MSISTTAPKAGQPSEPMLTLLGYGSLVTLAYLVGGHAFNRPANLLMLFALPAIMSQVRLRGWPALVMLCYWVGANTTLIDTLKAFDPESGWLAAAYPATLTALLTLPFLLANPANSPWRFALSVSAAMLLVSVPPIGLLGWQSPLFAAAVIFPQTGWLGILLTSLLMGLFAGGALSKTAPVSLRRAAMLVLALSPAALLHDSYRPVAPGLAHWIGVDTRFAELPDPEDVRGEAVAEAVDPYLGGQYDVVVLPESVLPSFSPADQLALNPLEVAAKERGVTVIAGATHLISEEPRSWRNVLQAFGATKGVIQESRLPAPVGNWQIGEGVPLRPLASDLMTVQDRRGVRTAAVSICYENLVLWGHPGLLTGQADVLVAVGNHWFAGATRIPAIDRTSVWALARLGGVPRVTATNLPG